jgi:ABC-type nitrate/sulfonate/bicarbonate transport system ATPase subunit
MERGGLAVEVRGLVKSFDGRLVLAGIDLEAPWGGVVAVVGPNGSGKTTLLRIIAGLERPDRGIVRVGGRALLVFQENLLLPWMRLRENIALGLRYARLPRRVIEEKVGEASRLLGLEEHLDKYPWQVSGGTARKAAIARILVLDPDILLLDEPLAGLDVEARGVLLERLARVAHEKGKTVVVVDHSIESVAPYADRVYIISHPPARILARVDLEGVPAHGRLGLVYEALKRSLGGEGVDGPEEPEGADRPARVAGRA